MESIQKFCGLPFNETLSVWDKKYPVFSSCFLWNIISDPVHGLFMITCGYLFGISSRKIRSKAKGCNSCLAEFLCVSMAIWSLVEVILSYVLKQTHPPAYVLTKMLVLASWMMCFSLHFRCRRNLRQYKENNKYVLFFSLLILGSSSVQLYTVIRTITISDNLNLVRWPILYYGVFVYFFLNILFVLSSVGVFCLRQEKTSFNRSLPSLSRNTLSIQAHDSTSDKNSLVTSGSDSQGSFCEAYQRHRERHTDIYLGKAENTRNVFSKLLFWWCNKLILKGYHRQLSTPEDLFILPNSLDTRSIRERFSGMLNIQRHNTVFRELTTESITVYESPRRKQKRIHISLLKTLNKAFGTFYYSLGVLKFIVDCLGFAGPLLLNFLVNFMENKKV